MAGIEQSHRKQKRYILSNHGLLLTSLVLVALIGVRCPRVAAVVANNLVARQLIDEWPSPLWALRPLSCLEGPKSSAAEALAELSQRLDPSFSRAKSNYGKTLWLRGECAQAQLAWIRALVLSPDDELAALWLIESNGISMSDARELANTDRLVAYATRAARQAQNAGDSEAAIAWCELALGLAPDQAEADLLVSLYRSAGRMNELLATWQRVAEARSPDDAYHWWAIGQVAEFSEDWAAAARAYEEGAALSPTPYVYRIREARAYKQQPDMKRAEQAYLAASEAAPRLIAPYLEIGHAYRRLKHYPEALAWYTRALEHSPGNRQAYYYLGLTLQAQGDWLKARRICEYLLESDCDDVHAMYCLGLSIHESEPSESVRLLERAIAGSTDKPWLWALLLGDWKYELGDMEGCLTAYEQALAWRPGDERINARIRMISTEPEFR